MVLEFAAVVGVVGVVGGSCCCRLLEGGLAYKYWRDWLGLDSGLVSTSSPPDTTDLAIPSTR